MKKNITHKKGQKPDIKNDEKPRPFLKRWGILSYLRELSVVIIGILITLSITNAINNYNRQQELKGMLKLVKQELNDNRKNLLSVKERWDGEQRAFLYLKENLNHFEKIPADTLKEYSYTIGAIYSFTTKNDSYDVLKNSTIKQYIKQKDLLPQLSKVYRGLDALNGQLEIYSRRKSDSHNSFIDEMDTEDAELFLNNPAETFHYALKEKKFRSFLVIGRTILSPGIFDANLKNIDRALEDIEKYGY